MAAAILAGIPVGQGDRSRQLALEGLLDHYFAEERSVFADSDCEWFMETANKQLHWQKQVPEYTICWRGRRERKGEGGEGREGEEREREGHTLDTFFTHKPSMYA